MGNWFWVFAALFVLVLAGFGLSSQIQARRASTEWCHAHGYTTGSVTAGSGKFTTSSVVCLDHDRRIFLPE